MKKIKYGVIGVGGLGQHHARWASRIETIDLVGIYDIDSSRAEQIASEIKCQGFDSLEDLLSHCDAVSIVTTTSNHCDVALKAIGAGKHVLVEKPIASNLEDADKIITAAEKKGVKLTVGHIERFNPALHALSEYDIRPSFVEAHRLAAFNPRGADVAVVLDLMIHDIDLVLHLIQSPVKAIAASAVSVISDTDDIANARLTFENGAVANLTASRISLQAMRKLRIFQSSGYFSLDLAKKQADLYRLLGDSPAAGEFAIPLGESGKKIGFLQKGNKAQDMLEAELISFADCIINDTPPAVTGAEGREALEVALRVIEESKKAADTLHAHEQ
ncbi:MAG: Gfo/Idh/MocA family oxidoreductase [candidate division Zixibacteria bacterium]|nr:Gfo/Idh/MocA family oxidoreductase [candidate division Zixibacteria bacterium]